MCPALISFTNQNNFPSHSDTSLLHLLDNLLTRLQQFQTVTMIQQSNEFSMDKIKCLQTFCLVREAVSLSHIHQKRKKILFQLLFNLEKNMFFNPLPMFTVYLQYMYSTRG